MIKLIVGPKGSGKTKVLVENTNSMAESSNGNVVFIAKGKKLIHEVKYSVRFIDTEDYSVDGSDKLYGLIAGVISSNFDAHDIFVDSGLKIIGNDLSDFTSFVLSLDKLCGKHSVSLVMTSSLEEGLVPDELKKYLN